MTQRAKTIARFRAETKRVSASTAAALWVCLGMTILMFSVSFCIPPKGVIDPSAFKAAGFLFGFATLFEVREAIREGLGVKLTHGETVIEVHDLDGGPAIPAAGAEGTHDSTQETLRAERYGGVEE